MECDEVREPRRRNSPSDPASKEMEDRVCAENTFCGNSLCSSCWRGNSTRSTGTKKHRTFRKKSRQEHIIGNYCRLNTSCMERQLASVQTGEEHGASDRRRHLPTRSTIHCDDNGPHSDVTHRTSFTNPLLSSLRRTTVGHSTHTAPVWHSRQTERALDDVLSASTQNGLVRCRPLDLAQIPCWPANGPS